MKKLICLVLVLTFCVCLACPAFAAEIGDEFLSSPGTEPGDCEHGGSSSVVGQKDPTCTEDGYTGDLVCDDCGEVIEPGKVIPSHGHHFEDGICEYCGLPERNPQTGDTGSIVMWMIILAVAAAGLVAVTVTYRKKFANQ